MRVNTAGFIGYLRRGPFFIQIAALTFLSLLLIAVSVNAHDASRARKSAERWYAHTLDVLLETSRLRAGVYAEMRGERGYLLTHNERFLDPYTLGRGQIARTTAAVAWLTRDNPVQVRNITMLRKRLRAYEGVMARTIATERAGRHNAAVDVVRSGVGKHHIDAVLATIDGMDHEEKALLGVRRASVEAAMLRTDRYQHWLTIVGFLLVGLATWMAIGARRTQRIAAQLNVDLDRLASSDALTGLANRRAFFARLDGGSGGRAVMAILDVDHFKRVNDLYGHPAGDRLLQEVATILRESVRGTDTVARIGGEEFAILMPDTTMEQGMQVCERIRARVQSHVVALADARRVQVSISVGIASRVGEDSADAWVGRADAALYRAKAAGRNRVLQAA